MLLVPCSAGHAGEHSEAFCTRASPVPRTATTLVTATCECNITAVHPASQSTCASDVQTVYPAQSENHKGYMRVQKGVLSGEVDTPNAGATCTKPQGPGLRITRASDVTDARRYRSLRDAGVSGRHAMLVCDAAACTRTLPELETKTSKWGVHVIVASSRSKLPRKAFTHAAAARCRMSSTASQDWGHQSCTMQSHCECVCRSIISREYQQR
jgi:hypothetical protein